MIADQGEGGKGLTGNPKPNDGWTKKWLKHKKRVLKEKQNIPLEMILNPFISKFKFLKDIRQAAADCGAAFFSLTDQKGRLELGKVVKALMEKEQAKVKEEEDTGQKRMKELGVLQEQKNQELRDKQDRIVNSCKHWLLLNVDRVESESKKKIEQLVVYWRENLSTSLTTAVFREREITLHQLVRLKKKEENRINYEDEIAKVPKRSQQVEVEYDQTCPETQAEALPAAPPAPPREEPSREIEREAPPLQSVQQPIQPKHEKKPELEPPKKKEEVKPKLEKPKPHKESAMSTIQVDKGEDTEATKQEKETDNVVTDLFGVGMSMDDISSSESAESSEDDMEDIAPRPPPPPEPEPEIEEVEEEIPEEVVVQPQKRKQPLKQKAQTVDHENYNF